MLTVTNTMKDLSYNTVFEGFSSLHEAKDMAASLFLDTRHLVYIKVFENFYSVGFEEFNRQCIVYKDYYFYNDNGIWKKQLTKNSKGERPRELINDMAFKNINNKIYRELLMFDPSIECYIYRPHVDKFYVRRPEDFYQYFVLLGLFFKDVYYKIGELKEVSMYFKNMYAFVEFFNKHPQIESINPFKQRVKTFNNEVYAYKFEFNYYNRVLLSLTKMRIQREIKEI